jgi:hypothetical protein
MHEIAAGALPEDRHRTVEDCNLRDDPPSASPDVVD